jgi:SPX domain protein involved in polyphosphate accumulation
VKLTQEDFFLMLEQEMKKIQGFTFAQVEHTRSALSTLEKEIAKVLGRTAESQVSLQETKDVFTKRLQDIGDNFLQLEKYVNINFMGFHKILKKHDKRLPNPCRSFYTKRLQNQSWIRGDYSDVMVTMSRMYATLRHDKVAKAKDDAKQVCNRLSWFLPNRIIGK